jgi:energy-coupling factor transporter ATP-binding protein EcfA2
MPELKGLIGRCGDLVAVDDLSFTVAEGQMFGFVGPNGAGKTTAMRIVLGMLVPDTSEVHWCGQRMNNESRHGVGHIPQDHGQTFSTLFAKTPRPGRSERQRPAGGDPVDLVERRLLQGAAAVGVARRQPTRSGRAGEAAGCIGEQPGAALDRPGLLHRHAQDAVAAGRPRGQTGVGPAVDGCNGLGGGLRRPVAPARGRASSRVPERGGRPRPATPRPETEGRACGQVPKTSAEQCRKHPSKVLEIRVG